MSELSIQTQVQDQFCEIQDSAEKAAALINDLERDYQVIGQDNIPSFTTLGHYQDRIKDGTAQPEDEIVSNIEKWVCHYKRVMLKISMLSDYMSKVTKAINEMEEPVLGIDWETGRDNSEIYKEMVEKYAEERKASGSI